VKITDVEVMNLVCQYPPGRGFRYHAGVATGRYTTLIRISTDDGLEGWGSVYSHPDVVRLIVEAQLRPQLMGREIAVDGFRDLTAYLKRLVRWYGRKGAALSAVGGIDVALWDIAGQCAGKSIAELLGRTASSVPAYASGLLWKDDLSELETEAREYAARGFRCAKLRVGRSRSYDAAAVDAVRRGIGGDCVMADGMHRYSFEDAVFVAGELSQRGATWFEEPFQPEDLENYAKLRENASVPIAAGENEFGYEGFRELLTVGAVDIVQPDVSRAGGITECFQIAELAAVNEARVATHTWSDALALIANAHLIAAAPTGFCVEVDQTGNPLIEELLEEPLVIRDGMLQLPQGPGLGVKPRSDMIEAFTLARDERLPEGNYADIVSGSAEWTSTAPYGERSESQPSV
jgi:D-galactarolactone cycloisomerase